MSSSTPGKSLLNRGKRLFQILPTLPLTTHAISPPRYLGYRHVHRYGWLDSNLSQSRTLAVVESGRIITSLRLTHTPFEVSYLVSCSFPLEDQWCPREPRWAKGQTRERTSIREKSFSCSACRKTLTTNPRESARSEWYLSRLLSNGLRGGTRWSVHERWPQDGSGVRRKRINQARPTHRDANPSCEPSA